MGAIATLRLYRAALGPARADHYLAAFGHFDARGRSHTSWNTAAAAFNLPWLIYRRLWVPAGMFAMLLAAGGLLSAALWQLGVSWPVGVKVGLSLAVVLVLAMLPGLFGTALLHGRVRRDMIAAVYRASNLDAACESLQAAEQTHRRRCTWALAVVVLGLVSLAGARFVATMPMTVAASPAASAPPAPVAAVPPPPARPVEPAAEVSAAPPVEAVLDTKNATDMAVAEPEETPAKPEEVAPSVSPRQALPEARPPPSLAPQRPAPPAVPRRPAAVLPVLAAEPDPTESAPVKALSAEKVSVAVARTGAGLAPTPDQPASATAPEAKPEAGPETAPSARDAPTPPRLRLAKGHGVAVGMFGLSANADRAVAKLEAAGLPVVADRVESARGPLTRVRVGPFDDRAQAEAAATRIRALNLDARVYAP